ncbi:MAG: hypothetical protein ACREK6_14050 [Candidatus Rokuibacteriota bacterium]
MGAAALLLLGLLASPASGQVVKAANQSLRAVTQDGRFVVLQPNGSWKYVEEGKAAGPAPAAAPVRPPGATMLLAGRQVPYGIWIDRARWRLTDPKQNAAAEHEFMHASGQAGALIVSEPTKITPDSWKQIVINNARREAPDARITREEKKTVNGVPVLLLQSEGTGAMGPFIYYGYYYTGPRGAVQVVTYTFAGTFEQYRADLTAFLDGFVVLE